MIVMLKAYGLKAIEFALSRVSRFGPCFLRARLPYGDNRDGASYESDRRSSIPSCAIIRRRLGQATI